MLKPEVLEAGVTVEIPIHSPREEKESHLFKVLVLGDPEVGKTSFIRNYISGAFSLQRFKTMSVDFHPFRFEWDEHHEVDLHFWDVPGQQTMNDITSLFFRKTDLVIVIYDVTRPKTMTKAREWKKIADQYCISDHPFKPPSLLLANKIDLVCSKSEDFDTTTLNQVVKEEGFQAGFAISNLGNYNVKQSVKKLVELGLQQEQQLKDMGLLKRDQEDEIILLEAPTEVSREKKKCVC